jgi:hypothetical protein
MSDELLERATRALAAKYTADKAMAHRDVGLRRLERMLSDSRPRHRPSQVVALVAAASLLAMAAWGMTSGRLPRWFRPDQAQEGVLPATRAEPKNSESMARAAGHAIMDSSAPSSTPPSAVHGPELVAPSPPVGGPFKPRNRGASETGGGAALAPAPSAAPDLDALYREAHEAHFTRRDPPAALAAWERYIAAAGANGRMTLEARYNRAIALVRLNRNEEAKRALLPFARGEFGGYRRDDAARLLESLH